MDLSLRAGVDDYEWEDYFALALEPPQGEAMFAEERLPADLWREVAERVEDFSTLLGGFAPACRLFQVLVSGGTYISSWCGDLSAANPFAAAAGAVKRPISSTFAPLTGQLPFAYSYEVCRSLTRVLDEGNVALTAIGSLSELLKRRRAERPAYTPRFIDWFELPHAAWRAGIYFDESELVPETDVESSASPLTKRSRIATEPTDPHNKDDGEDNEDDQEFEIFHDSLHLLLSWGDFADRNRIVIFANSTLVRHTLSNCYNDNSVVDFDFLELHRHLHYALKISLEMFFVDNGGPLEFHSESNHRYFAALFMIRDDSSINPSSPESWNLASDMELADALLKPQRALTLNGEMCWGADRFPAIVRMASLLADWPFREYEGEEQRQAQICKAEAFRDKILALDCVDSRFTPRGLALGESRTNPVPIIEVWRLKSRVVRGQVDQDRCVHRLVVGVLSSAVWT